MNEHHETPDFVQRTELSKDFRPVKIEKTIHTLEEIDPEVQAFEQLLELSKFNQGGANLELAFGEALENAWEHGNKEDPTKTINFSIEIYAPNKLRFTVQDQGEGFDVSKLDDPTSEKHVMDTGGRGWFLMSKFGKPTWNNSTKTLTFEFIGPGNKA